MGSKEGEPPPADWGLGAMLHDADAVRHAASPAAAGLPGCQLARPPATATPLRCCWRAGASNSQACAVGPPAGRLGQLVNCLVTPVTRLPRRSCAATPRSRWRAATPPIPALMLIS